MTVLRAEALRVLRTGWVWCFIALCATANLLTVWTAPTAPAYEAVVAETAQHSTHVDAALIRAVPIAMPAGAAVRRDLTGLGDVFASTDYPRIRRIYTQALQAHGFVADAMNRKYAVAASVAAERARTRAGESLYVAGQTSAVHRTVFRAVLPAVTIESILLATLLVLHVIGTEQTRGTTALLYSSRIGRRLALFKAVTATSAALAGTLLLTAGAWGALLVKYPITAIRSSDIESGFNLVDDPLLGTRPFLTWSSMTVTTYAVAVAVLTLALIAVFSTTAAALTTVVREPYITFAVLLAGNGLVFALPLLLPVQPLPFFIVLTPIWTWLKQPEWFTDGGFDILWPHFETIGTGAAALAAVLLGAAAHRHFLRKDLQ